MAMLMTTTPSVEGKQIVRYLGVVTGETIIGANVFRDFLAGVRDFFRRPFRFLRSGFERGQRYGS